MVAGAERGASYPLTDGGGATTLPPGACGATREIPAALVSAAEGGGGTILAARVLAEPRLPEETFGGGGTTFDVSVPLPERFEAETLGGGGTTFVPSALPEARFPEVTLGGGGTTSCVPKILPMILLMKEGACVGGGGTTVGDEVATPLSSRRRSWAESADGGGATMEGAGRFNFAFRASSRSGVLTGGGTTATLVIRTRVDGTSGPLVVGAGGTTLALSAGVDRA